MTKWWAALPLAVLLALAVLGGMKLFAGQSDGFGRSDGRAVPTLAFDRIGEGGDLIFNPSPYDKPILVNLFASWCAPCRLEHPYLVELGQRYPDQMFGLLYEDTLENGAAFLAELGDPFTALGHDPDGLGGLDFGLTGVPESFIVNTDGQIILHIRGPLDDQSFAEVDALLGGDS